jgi:predicted XRE-type DNA-binding protein
MATKKQIDLEESSGNVFADIGVPNAEEYLAKTKLAYQINRLIEARGLKQIEAAELLGIDQPKISALACGRLSGFSMERLFRFLAILNQDVVIMIKPHDKKLKIGMPHIFVNYTGTNVRSNCANGLKVS